MAGRRSTRELFELFDESQWWSADKIRDLQRSHLSDLVRYARKYVPFYSNRLDAIFSTSGEIDWDRWGQIPVLRRSDMLSHAEEMRSPALPGYHGDVWFQQTSGSTGDAITVATSGLANAALAAATYRAHSWHGFDWSQNFAAMSDVGHPAIQLDQQLSSPQHWGPPWIERSSGIALGFQRNVDAGELLTLMERHDVRYLAANPTRAQFYALEARRLGLDSRLDAIWSFGTAASAEAREDCMETFGAKLASVYGSKEGQLIAVQCPASPHFHINEETTLVEIVDDEGHATTAGELGRVVVTPLFNFAQPTIRYDQGDLAVAGEKCVCGRSLKVLQRIAGRTLHIFSLPDGRRILPAMPPDLGSQLGARYWQLAQTGPCSLELRYVPGSRLTPDLSTIVSVIRAATDEAFEVTVLEVNDLPRSAGGKYLDFLNEYTPAEHRLSS